MSNPNLLAPPSSAGAGSSSSSLRSGHSLLPHRGAPWSGTTTGSATPIPGQVLTATSQPSAEKDGLGTRLRNMLERPKYALFSVTVEVLELGNVPQLDGVFEAAWKFHGHQPHGKEAARLTPKASMPDLRSSAASHLSHLTPATQSTVSLRSDTSLSSTSSPAASIHSGTRTPALPQDATRRPIKSLSTPPLAVASSGLNPFNPRYSPPRSIGKKVSDPTPLRKSTGPEGQVTDSPELLPATDMPQSASSTQSMRSMQAGSSGDAASLRTRSSLEGIRPSALRINTGAVSGSGAPSRANSALSGMSTGSTASSLAVRNGYVGNVPPPLRSGTGPSPSVLLEPPGKGQPDRPPIMVRSPTDLSNPPSTGDAGTTQVSSTHADSQVTIPRPKSLRGVASTSKSLSESSHRKGTTPARKLKQHTCTWEYTVTHTIRVPTGKPVSAVGTATPGRREVAPILGGGPLSDSGFRLQIRELRTEHSTTADHGHGYGEGRRHAQEEREDGSSKGKKEKAHVPRESRMSFGYVEIDLAPFANKGRMMRNFLLKESRTNATVKVAVDMRQIGGETNWAAPPLREGHHVTGMRDLVGDESQSIRADLALHRNSSNESSESCLTASQGGSSSLSLVPTRSNPDADMSFSLTSQPPPKVDYKGFEHHLREKDAKKSASAGRRARTPTKDMGDCAPSPSTSPAAPPVETLSPLTPLTPSLLNPLASVLSHRDSVLGSSWVRRRHGRHHYPHHSEHLHPQGPEGVLSAPGPRSDHALDHGGHRTRKTSLNLDRKAPEEVIEGIFNPEKALAEAKMRRRNRERDGDEDEDGSLFGVEEEDDMGEHGAEVQEEAQREGGEEGESVSAGTGSGAATPPAGAKRHKWGLRRSKVSVPRVKMGSDAIEGESHGSGAGTAEGEQAVDHAHQHQPDHAPSHAHAHSHLHGWAWGSKGSRGSGGAGMGSPGIPSGTQTPITAG